MKKFIVLLAVLAIAMPSMATVTLTNTTPSGTTVTIGYTYSGTPLPRAFALVLQATGGTITSVTPAMVGECNSVVKGFGIFPGTIAIDANGLVTSFGSPVEPTDLPGGPSALGTARVVTALGSLYVGDGNKPVTPGNLFTVVCSGSTTALDVSAETTSRGGVVGEDASTIAVNTLHIGMSGITPPPPPTGLAASDGTSATQKTLTWTASTGATSYDVYYNNKNNSASCVLLIANVTATSYNHVTNHGETTWYWVKAKNAAGASDYSATDSGYLTECYPATVPAKKTRWITYGRPDCWCYARNCRGDADGTSEGKSPAVWVYTKDLGILKSAWNKADAALTGNQICADFDRTSEGKSPPVAVYTKDLGILKSSWNLATPPGLPCEASKTVVAPSGPMP